MNILCILCLIFPDVMVSSCLSLCDKLSGVLPLHTVCACVYVLNAHLSGRTAAEKRLIYQMKRRMLDDFWYDKTIWAAL